MTFRRLIGCSAAMLNANARDIVFRAPARRSQGVFITRRDGENVLERVKKLVASGRFESVVARKRGGGPLLHDLIEQMRGCDTAIIHVTADAAPAGADRQPRIGGDVLIEIGAAMALYGREFVLLVEDGVELPPCLHGLRECRYAGDELNVPAMMRLLCALKSFTQRLSERPLARSDAVFAFRYMQKPDEAAALAPRT
jgi:hypothetical protein